ncbi:methyltransferase-like protein 22 isoform X2 [Zophobas morio]|uniref:methyltransferase-like protein 22 isoform X2 n=1 Tax=Zophobas morio TaxID=2755281 RepID=UPI0030834AB4
MGILRSRKKNNNNNKDPVNHREKYFYSTLKLCRSSLDTQLSNTRVWRFPSIITLCNCKKTSLQKVGLQIWAGSLVMCDLILHKPEIFYGKSVLELGAGTGLVSIVLSAFAKKVYCTDLKVKVLENCLRNIIKNSYWCGYSGLIEAPAVEVRRMDWAEDITDKKFINQMKKSKFSWKREEMANFYQNFDVLVAGDVIYDNELTRHFVKQANNFLEGTEKTLYVSLEKRINFVKETLSVGSPCYDYFFTLLLEFELHFEPINTSSIPQFVQNYERSVYQEVWKITKKLA